MSLSDQSLSTVVVVDSADVTGSVGRQGFLQAHLRPAKASDAVVDVRYVQGSRCDIVAQRIAGRNSTFDVYVPDDLKAWYSTMVATVEVPDTTVLFIMSMSEVVRHDVWRHATSGVLVQPPSDHNETWTDDQNAWLAENFDPAPLSDEQLAQALRSIRHQLTSVAADLVIFNTSTFIPGEKVYWFRQGDLETVSIRAARTNLTVDKLARELDLTLVDVDRVTAELGAGVAVTGPATYSAETLDALADETITIILDLEGISRIFASDAMQLTVPRYDRRTTIATLTRWHVAAGSEIKNGDPLFDLRFGDLHSNLRNGGGETGKDIEMSVVAGRTGFVDTLSVDSGESIAVGSRVGVITSTPDLPWDDIESGAQFPVGIRVVTRDDE